MLFSTRLITDVILVIQSVVGIDTTSNSNFKVYNPPPWIFSHSITRELTIAGDGMGIDRHRRAVIPIALAYLKQKHGIPADNIRVTASHTNQDTGVSHICPTDS